MAWDVTWGVSVDGRDVTSNMRPFLTQISVSDKDGTSSDSASLSFDDTEGQVLLPKNGARIVVTLQGVNVFEGTVDSVRSSGSRGGGRSLSITAKGVDAGGKAKASQRWHMDDATLGQAFKRAGEKAGLSDILVDPSLAEITRSYWSPDGASFLAWGQSLARELGATFKIRGDRAVLAKRGQGASASGAAMPVLRGEVGRNVIRWDIAPVSSRPRFKSAKVRYFDRESGTYKQKSVEVEAEGSEAESTARGSAADSDQADAIAQGRKTEAERQGGEGTVELDLAPEAQAEGTFELTGARPGIDGTYRITGVTHSASRGGGSVTALELKQPQKGAGLDGRKS